MADMEQPSRLLEGRFDHYFKKMVNGQRTVLEGRDVKFFSALAKEVLGREAAPLDLMQDAALAADVIRQLAHALEHAKEADLKALGLKLLRRYFRIRLHFHADGRIEIERFPDDSAPDARRHPENSAA
jgi:hypothetical protein